MIVRITTSPHGLYVLGYMRATKDYTISNEKAIWCKSLK